MHVSAKSHQLQLPRVAGVAQLKRWPASPILPDHARARSSNAERPCSSLPDVSVQSSRLLGRHRTALYANQPGLGGNVPDGQLFSLRQGQPSDLPTIRRIILEEMMNPLSLEPTRFVAATDKKGAILGFGQLAPLSGSSTAQEIRSVVVLKEYRGQGIGTAVVRALLDRAGNAPVYLTTIEGPNVPFYARLGIVELPREQVPPALVPEALAGNVVTQLFFRKRCLVLGRVKHAKH